MDGEEVRDFPIAEPSGAWMVPSDPMVIRRYKPLKHFRDIFEKGFRAGQAAEYEEKEGRVSFLTRQSEKAQGGLSGIKKLKNGRKPDFVKSMIETRKAARHYYYPNCWRIGTHEDEGIWKRYAKLDEEMRRGVAIDTTIGKLRKYLQPEEDLHMGAVWYQERTFEFTPQFPWYSLYFFKDREYDEEQEFRVVANQGGNPIQFIDGREWTEEMLPENPEAIYLEADYEEVIDRVLLAPGADDGIRKQVEGILDDVNVDVPVVDSQIDDDDENTPWDYDAAIVGPSNYSYSDDFLNKAIKKWIRRTDWEEWATVDAVQLNQENNRAVRKTFVELYRYRDDAPELDIYGQDEYNYQTQVYRIEESELKKTYKNEAARQYDDKI